MAAGIGIGRLLVTLGIDPKEFETGLLKNAKQIDKLADRYERGGKALSIALTAPIVAGATVAVRSAITFEGAFAGVEKTVNGTAEELEALRAGILEMESRLPSTANEIAAVAEAAGQLGIQTENVLAFTEVMLQLGETTNLAATEGATAFARFGNIMGSSQDDFDRMGSSVVELGNNLATTEAEIVDMALRLAGTGNQVGLTEAETLGLAAALSSVGVAAEAGGTAFSRLFSEMASAVKSGSATLEGFAAVAGLSVGQFKRLFEEDAARAVEAFIRGVGRLQESGRNVFAILENLGVGEVRIRDAILRLAGANDLLARSLKLSKDAWDENTALQEEFAKRLQTTEAQLQIARNRVVAVAREFGAELAPALVKAADSAGEWLGDLRELVRGHEDLVIAVGAAAAALGPLTFAMGGLVRISSVASTTLAFLVANPLGALSIGVVAAAAGIGLFSAQASAAAAATEDMKSRTRELSESLEELQETRQALGNFQFTFPGSAELLDRMAERMKKLGEEAGKTEEELRQSRIDDVIQTWSDAVTQATDTFLAQRDTIGETRAEVELYRDTITALNVAKQELIDLNAQETEEFQAIIAMLEEQRTKLAEVEQQKLLNTEAEKALSAAQQESLENIEAIIAAYEKLKEKEKAPRTAALEWQDFMKSIEVTRAVLVDTLGNVINQGISNFSRGIGTMIAYGRDFGETMDQIWRSILATAISSFIELAIQWVLHTLLSIKSAAATAAAQLATYAAITYAATFAATSAIPGGVAVAPGIAAAATATMLAGASGAAVAGALTGAGVASTGGAIGGAVGLAEGGVVLPPGGFFELAEAGQPEVVLPLSRLETILPKSRDGVTINMWQDGQLITRRVLRELPDVLDLEVRA